MNKMVLYKVMGKILAGLFDFDGVVMDTEPQYSKFWGAMGKKYKPDVLNFEQKVKGCTLFQIYDCYFAGETKLQKEITAALNRYEESIPYVYVPGVVDFVESMRAAKIKTAVVTSSNKLKMACVYKAHPELPALFDKIFTADDYSKSKPDPQCFNVAVDYFKLKPEECVVFEDSFNGLKAAQAAHTRVTALATTNPRVSLEPLSDVVIDNFKGVNFESLFC